MENYKLYLSLTIDLTRMIDFYWADYMCFKSILLLPVLQGLIHVAFDKKVGKSMSHFKKKVGEK